MQCSRPGCQHDQGLLEARPEDFVEAVGIELLPPPEHPAELQEQAQH